MSAIGPDLPTLVERQVGSYRRHTGPNADVVGKAAHEPGGDMASSGGLISRPGQGANPFKKRFQKSGLSECGNSWIHLQRVPIGRGFGKPGSPSTQGIALKYSKMARRSLSVIS